jgi:hypothetical protein
MSRTDLIEYTYVYRRKGLSYQHIKKNVEGAAGDSTSLKENKNKNN